MAKKPRENRVPIMMSDEELTAIDDWRFANRVATRSDAVRRLVQVGRMADLLLGDMAPKIVEHEEKVAKEMSEWSQETERLADSQDIEKWKEGFLAHDNRLFQLRLELNEILTTVLGLSLLVDDIKPTGSFLQNMERAADTMIELKNMLSEARELKQQYAGTSE